MYAVEYTKQALNSLRRMPRNKTDRIRSNISRLSMDPMSMPNVKKLTDHPGYRLRVGNWRILYILKQHQVVIQVLKIAPRGKAYK